MRVCNMIVAAALTVSLAFAATGMAADVAKIGVVDLQKIIEVSSAGKAAKAEMKKRFTKMEEELQTKGAEVEELRKQLEREAMVMSVEKREDKEREYRIRVNDVKGMQQKYNDELKRIEIGLMTKIQKDLLGLAEEMGKKEGFLLILDRKAAIYYPTSVDVTDQLIEKYNAKFARGETEASKPQ
jgi:outer membrane protein